MKIIVYGLLAGMFLITSNVANALECEVTYKAKKMVKKKHIFKEVSNPKYKSGKKRAKGKNLKACENNALRPLRNDGWKITYKKTRKL